MRPILAAMLLLVAALATFPAALAAWEQRELMNQSQFVSIGQDVFKKPAVQAALTERVDREVVTIATNAGADPTLSASVSRPIVGKLVSQLPDSPIGKSVLTDSHKLMVGLIRNHDAVQTQNGLIVLDLRVVVQQVVQLVGATGLIDPKAVPPSTGQIVLVKESNVTREFEVARAFDKYARYLEILPLLPIALAIAVATARNLAFGTAGVVLASTAAIRIGFLLGPLASVVDRLQWVDPNARDAASATYHVIAMSFVHQDIIVAGIGLAVFAASLVFGIAKHVLTA